MRLSVKLSVAVHCLVFISEYGESAKVTGERLAMSGGTNPVIVRGILSSLKKAGIINVKSGTGGATLALPPEKITLGMVYSALKTKADGCIFAKHTSPSRLCPVGRNISAVLDKSYGKIEKQFDKDLETVTLADILADYHLRLQEENKK